MMTTTLRDLSTKELLNAREPARQARRTEIWQDCEYDLYDVEERNAVLVGKRLVTGGIEESVYATYDEIIAELNCREHVPNKIEAKRARQLKAKRK
jgi:hypothetical protein